MTGINEMLLVYVAGIVLLLCGLVSLHFYTRYRYLRSLAQGSAPVQSGYRYQPMLRLLSENDTRLIEHNKVLARKFRRDRTDIFRTYLKYLSRDYGQLLAGIRHAMVRSHVDRPDLLVALKQNQFLFAKAVCLVEYRLWIYGLGFGSVDVSGLISAIDSLRSQANVFTPATAGAR